MKSREREHIRDQEFSGTRAIEEFSVLLYNRISARKLVVKRLNALLGIAHAMEIETPRYKSSGPIGVSFVLLLIFFAVAGWVGGGPLGAVSAVLLTIFFFFGIPLATWRLAGSRGTEIVFRRIMTTKPHEKLLMRLHLPVPRSSEYILTGPPSLPSRLAWRLIQTVSIVILIASDASLLLSGPFGNTPMDEVTYFFGFGFLSLSAIVPFVVMLWVYEDSGVRRYDANDNTVSKVGAWVPQFFVGTGVASAFLRFVESIRGGVPEAAGAVTALLIVLVPISLGIPVYFHAELQAKYVKKFLASKSVRSLERRTIAPAKGEI